MAAPICQIFTHLDLNDLVLSMCTMPELVVFSHAGPFARRIFHSFLRALIRFSLAPFIPQALDSEFHRILAETKAGIVGSVPALLLLFSATKYSAYDLNIITPRLTFTSWVPLIKMLGGTQWGPAQPGERFLGYVRRHVKFRVPHGKYAGEKTYITISESFSSSVFRSAIGAADSSQMTLLTHNHLVVPYSISFRGQFALGRNLIDGKSYLSPYFDRHTPSEDGFPCGTSCHNEERSTDTFQGIFEVGLNPVCGVNPMREESCKWRLGHVCDNAFCPNNLKPVS
ncbi:hypothetical protein C8R43DRAFT_1118533 [Mycena crocata]|nr:hypothetical protein C8R43DRAFT_1118533 [Mycena crocata]